MNRQAVPPASLVSHLRTARRIVVLTGAGMSGLLEAVWLEAMMRPA
jgi:hypothetical protein